MSGGGGSQGGPSPTGNGGGDDCQPIYRGVRLTSPKAQVLRKLKENDSLDLNVQDQQGRPVLFALKDNEIAGTVTSNSAIKIINCIRKGHRYIAVIKTLDGADCLLEIRMESAG